MTKITQSNNDSSNNSKLLLTRFIKSVQGFTTLNGPNHESAMGAMLDLAYHYRDMNRFKEAMAICDQCLDTIDSYDQDSGAYLDGLELDLQQLKASLCIDMNRPKEAKKLLVQILERTKKLVGSEHGDYYAVLEDFGALASSQKKHKAAEKYYLEALEGYKRVYGLNETTYMLMSDLADVYLDQEKYKKAEVIMKEVRVVNIFLLHLTS